MQLLQHMEEVGMQFLQENYFEKFEAQKFRIGFHIPEHNSRAHLHMHIVILPFLGTEERIK